MVKSAATIVLVHGAWADGSSWSKVIPLLLAKNMQIIAVQLPLTSVEDDLAATNRIIADTDGPIVLVGRPDVAVLPDFEPLSNDADWIHGHSCNPERKSTAV
jgi:hypothetical protein